MVKKAWVSFKEQWPTATKCEKVCRVLLFWVLFPVMVYIEWVKESQEEGE